MSLSLCPEGDGSDPEFWCGLYEQRATAREMGGMRERNEAERLAWGELQNRWHMVHGERIPRIICAGCRRPIGINGGLDMIDGNRVHLADGYDCLIRHGERWRRVATQALVAMGLQPPPREDTA